MTDFSFFESSNSHVFSKTFYRLRIILNEISIMLCYHTAQYRKLISSECDVARFYNTNMRARSLVVNDLGSETKGSWFESGCYLYTELRSPQ